MSTPFFVIAAIIHVYIFVVESLRWGSPSVNKAFRVTPEQAAQNRVFAFNQGFYNLFLAVAIGVGLMLPSEHLVLYASASMCAAAVVLIFSQRGMLRAALFQGMPPAIGLLLSLI